MHFVRLSESFLVKAEETVRAKQIDEAMDRACSAHTFPSPNEGRSSSNLTTTHSPANAQDQLSETLTMPGLNIPVIQCPTQPQPLSLSPQKSQFSEASASAYVPNSKDLDDGKASVSRTPSFSQRSDHSKAQRLATGGNGSRDKERLQALFDAMKQRNDKNVRNAYYAARYHASSFPRHLQIGASELAKEFQKCLKLLRAGISEENGNCGTMKDFVRMEEVIQKWLQSDVGKYALWVTSNNKERVWKNIQEMKRKLQYPVEQVCSMVYRSLKEFKDAGKGTPMDDYFLSMCEMSVRLLRITSVQELSPRLTEEGAKKISTFLDKEVRDWYKALLREGMLGRENADASRKQRTAEASSCDPLAIRKKIRKKETKPGNQRPKTIPGSALSPQVTAFDAQFPEENMFSCVLGGSDHKDNSPIPSSLREQKISKVRTGEASMRSGTQETCNSRTLPNVVQNHNNYNCQSGKQDLEYDIEPEARSPHSQIDALKMILDEWSVATEQNKAEENVNNDEGRTCCRASIPPGEIGSQTFNGKGGGPGTQTTVGGSPGTKSSSVEIAHKSQEIYRPIVVDGTPFLTEACDGGPIQVDFSSLPDLPLPALALLEAFNSPSSHI